MLKILEVLKEMNSGKDVERLSLEDIAKRFRKKMRRQSYTLEHVKELLAAYFIIEESRNVVVFTQEGLMSVLGFWSM